MTGKANRYLSDWVSAGVLIAAVGVVAFVVISFIRALMF